MTAEQMQAVIERADAGKLERARKRLASQVAVAPSEIPDGIVTCTYNGDGTLATKHDAKGTRLQYSYDSLGGSSTNTVGRLAGVSFGGYTTLYGYTSAGRMSAKALKLSTATTEVDYTYDNEGRMLTVTAATPSGLTYTYSYDPMGRPTGLVQNSGPTLVSGVQYGPSNEMLSISVSTGWTHSETRTYNSRVQLTRIQATETYPSYMNVHLQYTYSPTQNNGQITQFKDAVSGEQVTYSYDSLNRLISGTTPAEPGGRASPMTVSATCCKRR